MYTHMCRDGGRHWYGKGGTCACGQVPNRLLSAAACDCGGGRRPQPAHDAECRAAVWARERNEWVEAHRGTDPPLEKVTERTVQIA